MTDSLPPSDASILTSVQAALGKGFTVERELGGGGMSRVFIATETALSRRVAVKVLSPDLFQGLSVERFAREVILAAQLQNPHIVPVLAAGTTAEGLPWYTMPFIDGESLRTRMQRGAVPLDEALRILRDVAEALEYAHGRGIVHRDIKPENVLLSGRSALVTDFGIAKAVSSARGSGSDGALTSVGLSLGTPAYMAPEQVAADPVDHRADLYAWGIMAYELLAGAHPFADRTQAQMMAAHVAEMPRALAEVRPELPAGLGALVMRCVAKLPAERPADAAALLGALGAQTTPASMLSGSASAATQKSGRLSRGTRWAAGALVVLIAAAAWALTSGKLSFDTTRRETPSLAVLPFEHQGESDDAYLTEGITDEIRSKLTGVRELIVIARTSSNSYRGTTKTPREIAEELGVRWLLTGTVRVSGSGDERRVIVRPELVEITEDGQPQSRWGQPFDVKGMDVLGLQVDVATQVVSAMEVPIAAGSDRAQLATLPTQDPVAYDLFLRGRAATNFGMDNTPATLRAAAALYAQAVARDSAFVSAWSSLAIANANLYILTPGPEFAATAKSAAERTLAMDPTGASGNKAMGAYLRAVASKPREALEYQERSVRADPNDIGAAINLAFTLQETGRTDDAVRILEASLQRDPRHLTLLRQSAFLFFVLGRLEDARPLIERLRVLSPLALGTIERLVEEKLFSGDPIAARGIVTEALQQVPADRLIPYLVNVGYGWVPDPAVVRAYLAQGPGIMDVEDRHLFYIWRADFAWMTGDSAGQRAWGDSALRAIRPMRAQLSKNPGLLSLHAQALAHAGDKAGAMREVREGLSMLLAQGADRRGTSYTLGLDLAANIAMYVGDHDAALDWLEEQRGLPMHYSPGFLRANAYYTRLRGNPRFERLTAESR